MRRLVAATPLAGVHSPVAIFRCGATYENYLASIAEMVLPKPGDVSDDLASIDPKNPVRVVAWIRSDQLRGMKEKDAWVKKAPADLWVTVVPKLKSFCQAFFKAHSENLDQLTLRLEQRLGLPLVSNKSTFIEILIEDPSRIDHIFRPCMDPSVSDAKCALGPPSNQTSEQYRSWIYRQYYSAFGAARPTQFPWTSLGYTFDWAPSESGRSRFEKFGESEFVVPMGAVIEIQSEASTAQYCAPQ